MADPLSIASGVAGLICLAGSVSKLFYNFYSSVAGAPENARDLASALFALNSSLSQVQEVLLDRNFVKETKDKDVDALENCLKRCTKLFSDVEANVGRSGLAEPNQGLAKKSWESVKWSYSEEEIEKALRMIAGEKAYLSLILDAFTARMTAGVLGKVEKLQVLAKKQDRRLKDIHVWCRWATGKMQSNKTGYEHSEYSTFAASQTYTNNDMGNLLKSSGSVLSLQIGDMMDDSVNMIWKPDPTSAVPVRLARSRDIMSMNPIQMAKQHVFGTIDKLLTTAAWQNQEIMDDLEDIGGTITILAQPDGDSDIERLLCKDKEKVTTTLLEYLNHATMVFSASKSSSLCRVVFGEYGETRKRLMRNIKIATEAYRFKYEKCTTNKTLRQQQEVIQLQKIAMQARSIDAEWQETRPLDRSADHSPAPGVKEGNEADLASQKATVEDEGSTEG
ncbi:uncharacterized protein PAC_17787 [Phialocephala subalpina]|uniref:Azaphilone pigments biosynthesis cluster protein L N-terminal domain-containing protein n=1 Tax=Phialocephala subalpina TaxID=576137 RepID=A0A1L7XSF9_9HELO|nr:uncharacterized protein PAC_17787 [Phialocephala subalpina]